MQRSTGQEIKSLSLEEELHNKYSISTVSCGEHSSSPVNSVTKSKNLVKSCLQRALQNNISKMDIDDQHFFEEL